MTTAAESFVAAFEGTLPDGAVPKAALDRFVREGFPTPSLERWRFTDPAEIAEMEFRPAADAADPGPFRIVAQGTLRACQIAFLDGRFVPELSSLSPEVGSLAGNPRAAERLLDPPPEFEQNPFPFLNAALCRDGAVVRVPKGRQVETPIHLLYLASARPAPFVASPRNVIVLEEGAEATVIESYLGPNGGVYLSNAVTEVELGDGAALDYYKIDRESHEAFHLAALRFRLGRGSRIVSHAFSFGARLSRTDLVARLEGEGAECTLNGLYEATREQVVDHHTTIDHASPRTTSRELYKGILDGRARGVFDGRVIVRKDAQKTNAAQTNKNLVLSKGALVHTKPELQIFADDVKCKHGATIGRLDEDVLFYLRSRGIPYEEARRLLIHAFACEIVDQAKIDPIRAQVGGCLRLMAAGLGGRES